MGNGDIQFNEFGVLPAGIHELSFAELKNSILVRGDGRSPSWDADWRAKLVSNLEILADQLKSIGIGEVFLDGSFVEDKDHPNDIDGYFNCSLDSILTDSNRAKLNAVDPHKSWGWEPDLRQVYRGYPKAQLPMWHQYRVELWQNAHPPDPALEAVLDNFSEFFTKTRDGRDKGIVKINL